MSADKEPQALRLLPLSRLQRDVLGLVLDRYPEPVRTEALIDQMYQLDPNGGPSNPGNNLGVHINRINHSLKPLGWRIEALGYGRRVLSRISDAA